MKTLRLLLPLALVLSLALFAGCSKKEEPAAAAPAAAPEAAQPAETAAPAAGTVVETMDAGTYTYALLDTGKLGKVWVAGPQTVLQVGNQVMVANPTPMPNYRSDTLDRTFEMLYFVQAYNVGGKAPAMGPMGAADASQPPVAHTVVAKQEVKGIAKAEGGQTVGDVYAKKGDLAGKTVKVRGKVVKFTGNIMGTNWLHIQDGTGKAGENDLTITTSGTATVGDVVTVSGVLTKDKDFGMGYFYPVIVENATITK